ncbi:MAG: hypothetical protein KDK00_07590 [Rhodobacteraceae bacterium]|nr:hypothetical protein [Paracoccaceae bacterium]
MANFTHVSTFVGGPFVHSDGITDLVVAGVKGNPRLYSASYADGGLQALALHEGAAATFHDAISAGPTRGTYGVCDLAFGNVKGTEILVPAGKFDDAAAYHVLGNDGGFESVALIDAPTGRLDCFTQTEVVRYASKSFLFASQAGESGFQRFNIRADLSTIYRHTQEDEPDMFLGDISAMDSLRVGRRSFLFTASAMDAGIHSFQITSVGETVLRDSVAPGDRSGFARVSVLETVHSGKNNFLLVGSAGTDSITVYRLSNTGRLTETDHRQDSLETRFDNIAALTAFEHSGRAFVLAGGSDDGLTLFEISPNGRLFLLAVVADEMATTLNNVQAIAVQAYDSDIQVFAAGSGEAGITQLRVDLGDIGTLIEGTGRREVLTGGDGNDLILGKKGRDTLRGGAGDDRLMDGVGKDVMIGGPGADVFVFQKDGVSDTVKDFVFGEDRLDLSDYDRLYHISSLEIVTLSWGFRIHVQGETIRIEQDFPENTAPPEFTQDDFIF